MSRKAATAAAARMVRAEVGLPGSKSSYCFNWIIMRLDLFFWVGTAMLISE